MAEILRAREAFAFTTKAGMPRIITPGQLISSDDPDLKGKEHLFEPVEESVSRANRSRAGGAVETASAEPGEKRSRTRSRRSKSDDEAPSEDDVKGDDNA